MGKLVTFWSPFAGRAGCTAVMGAVAAAMAMRHPELEIALCQMQQNFFELIKRMEYRGDTEFRKELYEKMGLNALALQYMQAELTSEKIRKCGITLMFRSLYLYPAVGRKETMEAVYEKILKEKMTEVYDFVFLDLEAGENSYSYDYMKAADLVVLILPQEEACWKRYEEMFKQKLGEKEICIIMGRYRSESRYNENYFRKIQYRIGGNYIGTIPDCIGYMDAMAEGRTLEFFLKNQMVRKREANYEFMEQTCKTTEKLKLFLDRQQGRKLQFFRTL